MNVTQEQKLDRSSIELCTSRNALLGKHHANKFRRIQKKIRSSRWLHVAGEVGRPRVIQRRKLVVINFLVSLN